MHPLPSPSRPLATIVTARAWRDGGLVARSHACGRRDGPKPVLRRRRDRAMKHLPTPIAMLAVLAACELPVSPGGPALPETPDLEIMTRADPVGIRVREVISVRGKRILHPHGVTECILKQEVVLAKGEAHTEWVSEYNPATCEFTIKRGDRPGLAAEILTARNYDLALARGGVNALGDARGRQE